MFAFFPFSRTDRVAPGARALSWLSLAWMGVDASGQTFEAQVIDAQVEIGYGVEVGDVDGDGKADILLADRKDISWYRNPGWEKTLIANKLTLRDNVCLAAADIDGDGKVEVAVGGQWNPGETSDRLQSGAVFYLKRPRDLKQPWKPVRLFHDPTTHRMRWVPDKTDGAFHLVVVPLHGIDNVKGSGSQGVNVRSYRPDLGKVDDMEAWEHRVLDNRLNVAHNFDVEGSVLYIGGAQGVVRHTLGEPSEPELLISSRNSSPPTRGVGEIRKGRDFIATIEPLHGNELAVYRQSEDRWARVVLTDALNQGHALAIGDLNGDGLEDIVVGWRAPDAQRKVGLRWYEQKADGSFTGHWISEQLVAVEDLKLADLDGDGRLDLVVAGRSTHNLVIFWNRP